MAEVSATPLGPRFAMAPYLAQWFEVTLTTAADQFIKTDFTEVVAAFAMDVGGSIPSAIHCEINAETDGGSDGDAPGSVVLDPAGANTCRVLVLGDGPRIPADTVQGPRMRFGGKYMASLVKLSLTTSNVTPTIGDLETIVAVYAGPITNAVHPIFSFSGNVLTARVGSGTADCYFLCVGY